MAKEINKKDLSNVSGGKAGGTGWYYSIEYSNSSLEGNIHTDGPFESEEVALSNGENTRTMLLNMYKNVGPVQVKYNSKPFFGGAQVMY